MFLSDALILSEWQLQTQQMMTSLFRSRIEYLIRTYHILVLIFSVEIDEIALVSGFNTI